jgi:hypothetical protein
METITKLSWAALALIHASPAMVLAAPGLVKILYGVDPAGGPAVLIEHRGALFLAVLAACVWAIFDPGVRRLVAAVAAISMIGFLIVYARNGQPESLRSIALVDLVGLAPLAFAAFEAWRVRPTP